MIRREPKVVSKFHHELAEVRVGMSPAIGAEMPVEDGHRVKVGGIFDMSLTDITYPVGGAAVGSVVGLLLLPSMLGLGLAFGAVGGAAIGYAISKSMA